MLIFENELNLSELFEYYYDKYGAKFKELIWDKTKKDQFHKQLVIILNGLTYRGEYFLETPLKDGDDLSFLYVYFGG